MKTEIRKNKININLDRFARYERMCGGGITPLILNNGITLKLMIGLKVLPLYIWGKHPALLPEDAV
jgi:hypothetical protein